MANFETKFEPKNRFQALLHVLFTRKGIDGLATYLGVAKITILKWQARGAVSAEHVYKVSEYFNLPCKLIAVLNCKDVKVKNELLTSSLHLLKKADVDYIIQYGPR